MTSMSKGNHINNLLHNSVSLHVFLHKINQPDEYNWLAF